LGLFSHHHHHRRIPPVKIFTINIIKFFTEQHTIFFLALLAAALDVRPAAGVKLSWLCFGAGAAAFFLAGAFFAAG